MRSAERNPDREPPLRPIVRTASREVQPSLVDVAVPPRPWNVPMERRSRIEAPCTHPTGSDCRRDGPTGARGHGCIPPSPRGSTTDHSSPAVAPRIEAALRPSVLANRVRPRALIRPYSACGRGGWNAGRSSAGARHARGRTTPCLAVRRRPRVLSLDRSARGDRGSSARARVPGGGRRRSTPSSGVWLPRASWGFPSARNRPRSSRTPSWPRPTPPSRTPGCRHLRWVDDVVVAAPDGSRARRRRGGRSARRSTRARPRR